MSKAEKIEAKLNKAVEKAEKLAAGEISSSTDLVHVDRSAPIAKREMLRRKQTLEKTRQEIQKLGNELRDELEKAVRNKLAESRKLLAPLQKQISQLEEGLWMVNLYLGHNEEIKQLWKGKAASEKEPICIRQLVLGMDEESALNPEDEGINHAQVEDFDRWLKGSRERIEQVLPDKKGIVAICPRLAETKEFEGMSMAEVMEEREKDRHTYFLIRNGNNVYRLWAEFSVGERMVPTPGEFQEIFNKKTGFRWEGEDDEWTEEELEKAEERMAAHQRHYLRVGLILQGLVDRTPVFHPLPKSGVNFMTTESHKSGRVKFIMDAEASLVTGREPFYDWLKRLNEDLRPGMRIIGAFDSSDWHQANSHRRQNYLYGHSRLSPSTASTPESLVPHTLDSRKRDGGFVFKYKRTDTKMGWVPAEPGWKRRSWDIPYKNKASCTVYATDHFILPIDFVTIEEMEEYMQARTERHAYIDMFPLLHKAIEIKKREAEEEKPFRDLLAIEVADHNEISREEGAEMVPDLVAWWKMKNRQHYALVGEDESRALKQIVAESIKRKKLDTKYTPPDLLEQLMKRYPEALLIARRPDGKHVVLRAMDDENVYVSITVVNKKCQALEFDEWKIAPRGADGWRKFYEDERWKNWFTGASFSEFPTGPEKEQFVRKHKTAKVAAITYDNKNRRFEVWKIENLKAPRQVKIDSHQKDRYWERTNYRWKRDQSRRISFEEINHWDSGGSFSGKEPWEPESREQYGERRVVLYRNPKVVERAEEQDRKIKEMEDKAAPLDRAWEHVYRDLNKKLDAQFEEAAFKEFMKEYGDESLWEGYKKTIDIERSYYNDIRADVGFIATLLERGVKVNGVKLKTLAKKAKVKVPKGYDGDWVIDTDGLEKETEEEYRARRDREYEEEPDWDEDDEEEFEDDEDEDLDEVEIDGEIIEGDFVDEDELAALEAGEDE